MITKLLSIDGLLESLIRSLQTEELLAFCHIALTNHSLKQIFQESALWEETSRFLFGDQQPAPALAHQEQQFERFHANLLELQQLKSSLQIIRGDIAKIKLLNDQPIDALAFPTNTYLTQSASGSTCASAVFLIAGHQQLSAHVTDHIRQYGAAEIGEIIRTPGFDAGVEHLFHCIGPHRAMRNRNMWLYRTYRNLFDSFRRHHVQNALIGSISTGSLGFPKKDAGEIAVQAYRDFRREQKWTGNIGIVCFEENVYTSFTNQKRASVQKINRGHNFSEPAENFI